MKQCTFDRIVILTDHRGRSQDVAVAASRQSTVTVADLESIQNLSLKDFECLIVDMKLYNPQTVTKMREYLVTIRNNKHLIFIAEPADHRTCAQANFLGAHRIVPRKRLLQDLNGAPVASGPDPAIAAGVNFTGEIYNSIFAAIEDGLPLPKSDIEKSCLLIANALKSVGIDAWLDGLKSYHSYTHRHSMHVAGFSIAFGLAYGMRDQDVQRLALGALMHDVGKARISLDILDKPTALTRAEMSLIRLHPQYSYEILIEHGQFSDEIVDIARHHHESLDGTGYPDGLSGSQISDMVRIVTIADVFSALVDQRAYKKPIPRAEAYAMMQRMDGKFDEDLLSAFEPIALSAHASNQPTTFAA